MILLTDNRSLLPPQPAVPRRKKGLKPAFKGFLLWHIFAAFCLFTNHLCSGNSASGEALIDLSHVFDNTTIYWATAKPLSMNVVFNGTTEKGYWYQAEEISAATHGGTHMDAPCHFAKGRWCIADIPLNHMIVQAVVIDISNHVKGDPSVHLTAKHLTSWEEDHGKIPKGSLLLVRTGWSEYWPDPATYTGTTERNVSLLRFPSMTAEAAQWIVDNRDVVGVGIDTMSVDRPGSPLPRSHQILMEKNIYALENVNNLQLLPPTGATAYVLPMKLKDASGAPCRIVASLPNHQHNSASNGGLYWHFMFFAILLYSIFAC